MRWGGDELERDGKERRLREDGERWKGEEMEKRWREIMLNCSIIWVMMFDQGRRRCFK